MEQQFGDTTDPLKIVKVAPGRYIAWTRPPASKTLWNTDQPMAFHHIARALKRAGVYQADIQDASLGAETQYRLKHGMPAPSWMPESVARDFGFDEQDTFLREMRRDFVGWVQRLRRSS